MLCKAASCSETPHFTAECQGAADGVCALLQIASTTPVAASELSLLKQLAKQIEDVNGEISRGEGRMEELSRTQPDNWEAELACLHGKDK